jgi:hypothetical protein
MPRCPRIHLAGGPLHIVQYGHNRDACFFGEWASTRGQAPWQVEGGEDKSEGPDGQMKSGNRTLQ